MVCVSRFESPDGVLNNISEYVHSLSALQTALPASNTTSFPVDVIHYVEDGRNPDIYTREFVELVVRQNQVLNGRKKAYREFRDVLAREIETAFPELGKEVGEVLQKTQ